MIKILKIKEENMKKTLLSLSIVTTLFCSSAFAQITSEVLRVINDLPKYSEEKQRAYFNKTSERVSQNEKLLIPLGYLYYYGYGTIQDKTTALNIFKRAAESGDDMGLYLLGKDYVENVKDTKTGLSYLLKSADAGNYFAAEYIAKLYGDGVYVKADEYYSLEYYHMAAKLGSADAVFTIAQKLLSSGDASNYPKGIEYLSRAGEMKHLEACKTLSKLYITENTIVQIDPKKHVISLICAADGGDLDSIKELADYYSRGIIVMIDNNKAVRYYEKYLELSRAQKLKVDNDIYYKTGVAQIAGKSYKKGVDNLKIAAKSGHAESAQTVARIYENGYGIEQDYYQSLIFYKMAQKYGIDTSADIVRVQSLESERSK